MENETERVRFEIKFWAAKVFRNRHLHFSIRDAAEELGVVGEIRWDIACQHEADVEGPRDKVKPFAIFLGDKLLEQAYDLDNFRWEETEPTGEFDEFTSKFGVPEEEKVAVPDYINELNRIDKEEVQDE